MFPLLEPLEARVFLSASPAVAQLHTDEAAAKADLRVLEKGGVATTRKITADLKTASDKAIAHAQEEALATAVTKINSSDSIVFAATTTRVNAAVTELEALELQLSHKPSSTALAAKVAAAKTALTTAGTNGLSAFSTANQGTALLTAAEAIAADGGTAMTDIETAIGTLSANSQTTGATASKAFSTDVSAITG